MSDQFDSPHGVERGTESSSFPLNRLERIELAMALSDFSETIGAGDDELLELLAEPHTQIVGQRVISVLERHSEWVATADIIFSPPWSQFTSMSPVGRLEFIAGAVERREAVLEGIPKSWQVAVGPVGFQTQVNLEIQQSGIVRAESFVSEHNSSGVPVKYNLGHCDFDIEDDDSRFYESFLSLLQCVY